jgi:hypothetical protein
LHGGRRPRQCKHKNTNAQRNNSENHRGPWLMARNVCGHCTPSASFFYGSVVRKSCTLRDGYIRKGSALGLREYNYVNCVSFCGRDCFGEGFDSIRSISTNPRVHVTTRVLLLKK